MNEIPHFSSWMTKRSIIYVFWIFDSAADLLLALALISKGLLHCINKSKKTMSVVSFFDLLKFQIFFLLPHVGLSALCVTPPTSLHSGLVLIIKI